MAIKIRVHWFANQLAREELDYILSLCSAGVAAASRENDLKACLVFQLKKQACVKAIDYKKGWPFGNNWIDYPEDADDAFALLQLVINSNMVAGPCSG